MSKKAFLVSFSPMTRVVVDVDDETLSSNEEYLKVIMAAREQMINSIAEYLNGETVDEVKLDEECPYPQNWGEKEETL